MVLVHVPPEDGDNWDVAPTHTEEGPLKLIAGLGFTIICPEAMELHPLVLEVNTKVAIPGLRPVTIPEFVTDAIVG